MSEETIDMETQKVDYTKYDFDRPDKFSYDHLRSLESIFSVFSRNFATDLSGYLSLPAELDVKKIEQIPFNSEYLEKKERDTHVFCISEFNKEQFLVQFEVGFLLSMYDKLLGGEFRKVEPIKKSITEYEKLTVEHLLIKYMYPKMQEAFRGIGEFDFTMYSIETDPQYARVTLPQDMVALITLSVKVGNELTEIQVILPYLSIESFIEKLSTDNVLKNKKLVTPEEQLSNIYNHLLQIERDFVADLGTVNLPLNQIMKLEEGDMIVLDPIDEGVTCTVGGKVKYRGKIGTSDGKKSVKIIHTIKEKDDEQTKKEKAEKIREFYENKYKEGEDIK